MNGVSGKRSSLSTAMLRISASLDLDTVLQEVVESARTLTGARYGAMATVDEHGVPQDFVTSGFSEDEHRQMVEWPEGPRLFKHFRDLKEPLRISDITEYVRSLGFSTDLLPTRTFQGTPMRHCGVHVGNFYLVEKEDGQEFTSEDEEILLVFASQAASAIAHARAYCSEQRARSDLETLIETSPVGVIVFDAQTCQLTSLNREARCIVEELRGPGCPAEHSLDGITCRFPDGREIALGQLPLSRELQNVQIVRGEEVVLSSAGGHEFTMLINATPIKSNESRIESVVVTMQNLEALQDLDRMRSEFLSMVSHELRMPLAAIKGSTSMMLEVSDGLDPAVIQQFSRNINQQVSRMGRLIGDLLDVGRLDAGTLSVSPRPVEVTALIEQARTTFLTSGTKHTVQIDLPPDLNRVMADPGRIVQVLNNLLFNAARHCPASSPIRITAVQKDIHIALSVSDKGRGLTPEQLEQVFLKPSSDQDRSRETEAGSSGLGLVICKGLVEAHGGRIQAESAGPGQGAGFTFTLPRAEPDNASALHGIHSRSASPEYSERTRILVVDDDPLILHKVREILADADYAPLTISDQQELSQIILKEKPALVLLDLVLNEIDGLQLMESIPTLAEIPVIIISGYGRDETIAKALEAGAEDYIVKPFSPTELLARIRAVLRRNAQPVPFAQGKLLVDYDLCQVSLDGQAVELTATEFELLRILSTNSEKVSTNSFLLRKIWGRHGNGDPQILRSYVNKLRLKLDDDPNNPTYIETVRGVGYRMKQPGNLS